MVSNTRGSATPLPNAQQTRAGVVYERSGSVVTLTLDSPLDRNALNTERFVALADFLDLLATEPALKIVLIRARGPMFCPGADMAWLQPSKPGMDTRINAGLLALNAALVRLRALPAVIVAAVHGAVAGGGLGLMNLADLVIASDETKFSVAYARIGATPDIGASYYLTRLLGERRALELLLMSESFGVERAQELGLINFCVPAADFDREVDRLVERLANGPGAAQVATKRLVRAAYDNDFSAQLNAERWALVAAARGAEFGEGVQAFVDRRVPNFNQPNVQSTPQ